MQQLRFTNAVTVRGSSMLDREGVLWSAAQQQQVVRHHLPVVTRVLQSVPQAPQAPQDRAMVVSMILPGFVAREITLS